VASDPKTEEEDVGSSINEVSEIANGDPSIYYLVAEHDSDTGFLIQSLLSQWVEMR